MARGACRGPKLRGSEAQLRPPLPVDANCIYDIPSAPLALARTTRPRADLLAPRLAAQIAAAREAIGDADFFLVARTDARGTSAKYGLEEAVRRANLYADLGADATFVEAPRGQEELELIGRETKVRAAVVGRAGAALRRAERVLMSTCWCALGCKLGRESTNGLTVGRVGVWGDNQAGVHRLAGSIS